jgi:hypothetical protein
MPADTPAEKQSFEAFLAKVPDAPSSAVGVSEEPAAEAEAPLADAAPEGAAEGAAAPPPARKPNSADPTRPWSSPRYRPVT